MTARRWLCAASMMSAVVISVPIADPSLALSDKAAATLALHLGRSKVTAGKKVKYSYSSKGESGKLVLQRTFGTAHVYRTVKKLGTKSGSGKVKAPEMGSYEYRLALKKSGHVVATSTPEALFSYGPVTLGSLLHSSSRTVNIGGSLYRYVWSTDRSHERILKRNSTSCRSATLTMGLKDDSANYTPTGSVSIIQETADPEHGDAIFNSVASFNATLSGDAFNISGHEHGYYGELYVNGTLSCYTTNGQP